MPPPARLAGRPLAGPAELSDHSTIPANLARVAENTGDRYAVARTALSRIPHGVAIIGAADGAERSCATGTAMYVSFVPPMVVIAEHPGSRTCKLIQRSGAFSVSFLHASQQDVAERAGKSAEGPDKFATQRIKPLEAPPDAGGAPAGRSPHQDRGVNPEPIAPRGGGGRHPGRESSIAALGLTVRAFRAAALIGR